MIIMFIILFAFIAIIVFSVCGDMASVDKVSKNNTKSDSTETTEDKVEKTLLNGKEISNKKRSRAERYWAVNGPRVERVHPEGNDDQSEEYGNNDNAEETAVIEASNVVSEDTTSRKYHVLIGALVGVALGLVVFFCGYFMFYMPNRAFGELEYYDQVACKKGINMVSDDDLERIEKYRNNSIILNKEKREDFGDRFEILQKAVERWREIKMIMKSDGSYLYGYESKDPTPASTKYEDPTPAVNVNDPSAAPAVYMEANDDPGAGPNANNGVGTQYSPLDQPTNSNHLGGEVHYRPYMVDDKVFIIRIGFTVGSIQPTDFPVYEEYQRFMLASGRTDIVTYEEYMKLMEDARLVDSEVAEYYDRINELEEINSKQKTGDDVEAKSDDSKSQQDVTIDSNEAEASIPTPVAPSTIPGNNEPTKTNNSSSNKNAKPLATIERGVHISSVPAGSWEGPYN